MNRVAILVPTYIGHLDYFRQFSSSYRSSHINQTADLWIVLSEEDETKHYPEEKIIFLPEQLRGNETRGIINKKKFYGLMQLKDQYEYIIVLDDDTLVNRFADLHAECEKYFSKKVLYGNEASDITIIPEVIKACCSFFSKEQSEIFFNKSGGLYLWFNQPSIYRCNTLDHFFSVTNMNSRILNLRWHDFDYYVYMIYLVLYQDFNIQDIKAPSDFGICEAVERESCTKIKSLDFFQNTALQLTPCVSKIIGKTNHIFTIHVDRGHSWWKEKKIRALFKRALRKLGLR